jgi:hypothetical protein
MGVIDGTEPISDINRASYDQEGSTPSNATIHSIERRIITMDRLDDLNRLLAIAKDTGDVAEIAKLEGKLAKCAPTESVTMTEPPVSAPVSRFKKKS